MPKGSPEMLLKALTDRIDELEVSAPVESAQSVDDITDDKKPIYGDDVDFDSYLVAFIGALDTVLMPSRVTNWVVSGNTLYVDVDEGMDDGEDAVTYEIPIDDLSFNMDLLDEDLEFVQLELDHLKSDLYDDVVEEW